MNNKWMAILYLALLAALASYEYVQDMWLQNQITRFMTQGPRFTAFDGQALCERIRALEEFSYGYRDAGRLPLDCDYGKR